MLDAEPAKLTTIGMLIMTEHAISIEGFEGEGCSCRDVAALAAVWAIGRLQEQLRKTLEAPGKSEISVN